MADSAVFVVIGAGPGGYVAAIRAAQLGMKVACVDKRRALGGTCLNVGCIPSKALLESSELYVQSPTHLRAATASRSARWSSTWPPCWRARTRSSRSLTDGVAFLFKKNKITSVQGTAAGCSGTGRVAVAGGSSTVLEAGAILLATGSEPASWPLSAFRRQAHRQLDRGTVPSTRCRNT